MNVYIPFIEMVCIWVGASTIISILRGKQKNKLLQEGKYIIDAIFLFAFAVINLGASYYTQKVRRKINTELPEIKCAVKILLFIFRDFGTALVFLVSYLQA